MGLSVTLADEFSRYIDAQVEAGTFASASAVVENALRLVAALEDTEAATHDLQPEQIAWLREAWDDGLASGDAGPLDMAAIKSEARLRFKAGR